MRNFKKLVDAFKTAVVLGVSGAAGVVSSVMEFRDRVKEEEEVAKEEERLKQQQSEEKNPSPTTSAVEHQKASSGVANNGREL